mgnify:FL=1
MELGTGGLEMCLWRSGISQVSLARFHCKDTRTVIIFSNTHNPFFSPSYIHSTTMQHTSKSIHTISSPVTSTRPNPHSIASSSHPLQTPLLIPTLHFRFLFENHQIPFYSLSWEGILAAEIIDAIDQEAERVGVIGTIATGMHSLPFPFHLPFNPNREQTHRFCRSRSSSSPPAAGNTLRASTSFRIS